VLLVAAMAQAGFSGEPRYALPGVALLAVAGAAGLTRVAAAAPVRAAAAPPARAGGRRRAIAAAGGRRRAIAAAGGRRRAIAAAGGRRRAIAAAAAVAVLAVSALPALAELRDVRAAQAHQWALARDLDGAVAAAGGREAVLACGRPYVGRYRGPLIAYALDVTKQSVEPDAVPRAPGVVFRARLTAASAPAPDAGPPFRAAARVGEWQVLLACSSN
jgi:hypothetical protein